MHSGNVNLSSIVIPENVTELGYYEFDECVNLKVLIIPKAFESKNNDYWIQRGLNLTTTIISKTNLEVS